MTDQPSPDHPATAQPAAAKPATGRRKAAARAVSSRGNVSPDTDTPADTLPAANADPKAGVTPDATAPDATPGPAVTDAATDAATTPVTAPVIGGQPRSLGHVLISSVKNEGPFMLEWVAHHRAIGFDLICVASNDCTDGTDLVLGALARGGAIRHLKNIVKPGDVPQHAGYAAMRRRFGLNDADWLMVLDADEFLHVETGAGGVADLTAAVPPDTDIIMLSPQTFGTSEDPGWQPGLVTEQFTRRLRQRHVMNRPVKTMARGLSRFRHIHNHSMMGYRGTEPLTVTRSDLTRFQIPTGAGLWEYLRNVALDDIRHGIAHYNHYAVKSLASYCLRQSRGRGAAPKGQENDRHTTDYFDRIAAGNIVDTGFVTRYGTGLRAEMDRLLALPGVAEAQAETESRYAALIDALID